ncbi:MAG: carbon monoxide dehydrogenase [Burkholderiales bacterium PBB5]|nr:MAG: carbon monoxide dehydrogenase [Burkholderiales bacterium PBB5]
MPQLNLSVNGQARSLDVDPATLLIDLLRGPLALTGTHAGCDTSQCGACTVLLDGQAVKSCGVLAVQCGGRAVTTIEGLAPAGGGAALHPIQQAFADCHGLQCGFCTPGMVMTTACLLAKNAQPSTAEIAEALEGNLCRCTGYVKIVAAVQQAATTLAGSAA